MSGRGNESGSEVVKLSIRSAHVWYDRRSGVTVRCDGRVIQSGVTVGWYSQV